MIVLDTHVWVWWVSEDERLAQEWRAVIEANEHSGLAVSAISCWEVAKLVEVGRLELRLAVLEWLGSALRYPGCRLAPLTPRIAAESTALPGAFHRDPADQILVATARVLACPILYGGSKDPRLSARRVVAELKQSHIRRSEQ